jgi:hypothetical protein
MLIGTHVVDDDEFNRFRPDDKIQSPRFLTDGVN